jgi:hypothetical protein
MHSSAGKMFIKVVFGTGGSAAIEPRLRRNWNIPPGGMFIGKSLRIFLYIKARSRKCYRGLFGKY